VSPHNWTQAHATQLTHTGAKHAQASRLPVGKKPQLSNTCYTEEHQDGLRSRSSTSVPGSRKEAAEQASPRGHTDPRLSGPSNLPTNTFGDVLNIRHLREDHREGIPFLSWHVTRPWLPGLSWSDQAAKVYL
jgi:hypothetical protein